MLDELSVWGLLPIAVPLLAWTAWRLGGSLAPERGLASQAATASVIAMGLVHASVGVLGELGLLTMPLLLGVLGVAALGAARLPVTPTRRDTWMALWKSAPLAWAALAAIVATAILTARLLPVWQWDSFGYHLPFVNLVLQHHGFADLPVDLRFVTTYPHNLELSMVWLRAFLPDDRLVDLAQVPSGVLGVALTAACARKWGASKQLAVWSGVAWLGVPLVFLQLPTNYVDVGTAAALLGAVYFLVLSPVHFRSLAWGGLALGCFLGSKPSAPVAVVALAGLTLIRSLRAGELKGLAVAGALTVVFGAERYAVMWMRHGNPVWPVTVKLGPVTLPGEHPVSELLAAGAALPSATGSPLGKLLVSWLAIDTPAVFDMKLGGLGLLFLVALPLAVMGLVRRRQGLLFAALGVALISPDPSLGRYVLAFPALVFALAASELGTSVWRARVALMVTGAAVAWQLHHAWPGLTGDGPAWSEYLSMNDDERRMAVGPHGRPTDYPQVWERVGRDESIAFDPNFEFPGLLWSPTLEYPVYVLAAQPEGDRFESFLDLHRVRVAAVSGDNKTRLENDPRWEPLFACRSADCAVFARRALVSATTTR